MGMHTSAEAGDNSGFSFAYRVVPVRREPGWCTPALSGIGRRAPARVYMYARAAASKFDAGSVVAELERLPHTPSSDHASKE
ncbi:MAG: hypothetical protein M3O70_02760 [Actinomycetota bacterium]|nr:hypothetical protein [Actinomycetota bacterium]